MGAIQQAFNQALGYAAIAAGPVVAKQKDIVEEGIRHQERLAAEENRQKKELAAKEKRHQEAIEAKERKHQEDISVAQEFYEKKKEASEAIPKNLALESKASITKDLAKAATKLYELNPTAETLAAKLEHEKMAEFYSQKAEKKAAKKAADTMSDKKSQKQEQKDIIAQFMSNIPQSYPIKEVIK